MSLSRCEANLNVWKGKSVKYFCSRRISIHSCLRAQIGCTLAQIPAKLSKQMNISENSCYCFGCEAWWVCHFFGLLISVISPPFPCFLWLSPISSPFSVSEARGHGPKMSRRTSTHKIGGVGVICPSVKETAMQPDKRPISCLVKFCWKP